MHRRRWIMVGLLGLGFVAGGLGVAVSATVAEARGSVPPTDSTVATPSSSTSTDAPGTSGATTVPGGEDTGIGPEVSVPFQRPPLIASVAGPSGPLVVVPVGCPTSPPAAAVFVGRLELKDANTAQFVIDQVRAGSVDGWAVGGQVQVRYGPDVRFLDLGDDYVVGAMVDPASNVLASKIREAAPLFGGDAVIGVDDRLTCPATQDPVQTLQTSGQTVDSGLLTPLKHSGRSLLGAVVRPMLVALAVLLGLVIVKQLAFSTGRSLRSLTVTEQPVEPRRSRRGQRGQRGQARRRRQTIRRRQAAARSDHTGQPLP